MLLNEAMKSPVTLLLILSTSLLLTSIHAAPKPENSNTKDETPSKDTTNKVNRTENHNATDQKTTPTDTPTELDFTDVITTTTSTTIVSHDQDITTPISPQVNEKSKALGTKKQERKSPKYLLYEVESKLLTLSLSSIEYILDLGSEVFAYSLADKLGYLKDSDDDPHIQVIEDNTEKLLKKLKERQEQLKKPVPTEPPTVPLPPETPSPPASMKYEIMKRITQLTSDEIDGLLNKRYDDEMIPFALGDLLGYNEERDALQFQYLEEEGGAKWRGVLEKQLKKAKLSPKLNSAPHDDTPPDQEEPIPPADDGETSRADAEDDGNHDDQAGEGLPKQSEQNPKTSNIASEGKELDGDNNDRGDENEAGGEKMPENARPKEKNEQNEKDGKENEQLSETGDKELQQPGDKHKDSDIENGDLDLEKTDSWPYPIDDDDEEEFPGINDGEGETSNNIFGESDKKEAGTEEKGQGSDGDHQNAEGKLDATGKQEGVKNDSDGGEEQPPNSDKKTDKSSPPSDVLEGVPSDIPEGVYCVQYMCALHVSMD